MRSRRLWTLTTMLAFNNSTEIVSLIYFIIRWACWWSRIAQSTGLLLKQTKCQCFWVAARWPLAAKCHLNWDTCFSFILLLVSYFVVVSFLDSPHPPPPHFLILSALHHRSAWIMDRIGREILPLPDEVTLRRCMKANWINGDLLRLVRTESVLGAEFVQAVCVCVCLKPPIAAFTWILLSCLLNPLVLYACLCDCRLSKSEKWNHTKAWENVCWWIEILLFEKPSASFSFSLVSFSSLTP